ncbi:hypothetical protein MBANPS3_011697 [Mucor bainieri]
MIIVIRETGRRTDKFTKVITNSFEAAYAEVKVTKDLYYVDFTDYEINRAVHLDNNRIKRGVKITRANAVNKILADQDVFKDDGVPLCLTNTVVLDKLKSMKQDLQQHVSELHKKDLLYYAIIDLATSSKKQVVQQALTKTQIKH